MFYSITRGDAAFEDVARGCKVGSARKGERGGALERLPVMLQVAKYSASELLRDGRQVEVRALRHSDRDDLLAAVARTSTQSLYRRFFGIKREFSEKEIAFFVDV